MLVIYSHLHRPSFNLAAEEYIFSRQAEDVLFLYVNDSSVILGSNQVLVNEVDVTFCNDNRISVLRRVSGGGAVYHDTGNLNYSFISTIREGKPVLSADFLVPVVDVLKSMDIPVEIGKRKDLWLPGGYKVSGTASHISKNRQLHHGTLLYDANLEQLQKSLTVKEKDNDLKGTASVPSVVKNIRTFLEEQTGVAPDNHDFFEMCIRRFSTYYGTSVSSLTQTEVAEILAIENQKYTQHEWNFKK